MHIDLTTLKAGIRICKNKRWYTKKPNTLRRQRKSDYHQRVTGVRWRLQRNRKKLVKWAAEEKIVKVVEDSKRWKGYLWYERAGKVVEFDLCGDKLEYATMTTRGKGLDFSVVCARCFAKTN